MREIKFRGRRILDFKWIYGSLLIDKDGSYEIYHYNKYGISGTDHVFPETVGQFTGITDDDNIDMYSGDILNNEVEVYWNNNWNAFCVRKLGSKILYEFLYKYIINDEIKITNNVYENPL